MSSWKGKSRGGISGYKIFIAILKYLGLPFAYFFLRFVVAYFFLFSPKSFRASFFYFKKVLKYNFFISLKKIFQSYFIFGQILLDKTAILGGFKTNFTFDFDGESYIRDVIKEGKGALLISAHVGNFEMAEHFLKRLNTKINIVLYDAEHEKLKKYLSGILENNNVEVIAIKDDFSHIFKIKNALSNNELVCIHADRFVDGSKKIKCNFLGKEAFFPTGPFYLAIKFRVPVSFVFPMKERKNHYHFYASPIKTYIAPSDSSKRKTVLNEIMKNYITEVENIIHKYPEQWFNYYKFWE